MRVSLVIAFAAQVFLADVISATDQPPSPGEQTADRAHAITLPGHPLGIAWGFLYGHSGAPAGDFVPVVREIGGGFTKVYLFWEQLEPRTGEYDWSALDKYVQQLRSPEEGLVSIFSASTWATEVPSAMLPPSPARNLDEYYRLVHAAVSRARGRVRFWQNDCEPNNPVFWAGTKEQFVAQLKTFHRAVKDADPDALVVVGGYDGLFNPPGGFEFPGQAHGLAFFEHVLREGGASFDLFDLRLYADPYTIPARVAHIRSMMQAAGREHPIICTEYNGPGFFELPANRAYFPLVGRWSQAAALPEGEERALAARAIQEEIAGLYAGMEKLAPQTQMFLQDCPPELDAKLRRMQARDLVLRNLFGLSAGVQKTLYWDFWHDTSTRDDMMTIMYGKLKLMERADAGFTAASSTVASFERLARALKGVQTVTRREVPEHPSVMVFDVVRQGRPALQVAWERRDAFVGEDQPPIDVTWPTDAAKAQGHDVFGAPIPVVIEAGRLRIELTNTPVFIELATPVADRH
jgi:hypothetical protein